MLDMKITDHGTITIVGVDPGTNYTGVAIFTLELPTLKILNIDTKLLNVFGLENRNMVGTDLQERLKMIYDQFLGILNTVEPFTVSIESPFMNRLRPAAVGSLSQCLWALELASFHHNKHLFVNKYPPSSVKNGVGAKGNADKDAMMLAILNHPEISSLINGNLISEHEIDAIAVAYIQLTNVRNNNIILLL